MNKNQLVLIKSTCLDVNGSKQFIYGTGYFIAEDLVLTANHVFSKLACESIRVRIEGTKQWFDAKNIPIWQNEELDAAIILTKDCIENPSVTWRNKPFDANEKWDTTGYPEAGRQKDDDEEYLSSIGFEGILHFAGGGGQRAFQMLDLAVNHPPEKVEYWKGLSGAPVFVGDTLAGILQSYPEKFATDRLLGIPTYELLKDPGFKLAIQHKIGIDYGADNGVLILNAENSNEDKLKEPVVAALNEIRKTDSKFNYKIVSKKIEDVLSSPGHLLDFIDIVCKAPIMIIDATGFQPGIMMVMGIRSVVKRGVTIVTTANKITESELSNHPFDIQEIKLVSLTYSKGKPTPKDKLINAIKDGRSQSISNPRYLDLPTYDAVRNPIITVNPDIKNKVLLLCPFHDKYNAFLDFVLENASNLFETENIVRMIDINSPQLVGQSLYEHIRWSKVCIIDWTFWRPNVFYELGVRLAASDTDPINLIELSEKTNVSTPDIKGSNSIKQKDLLLKLFQPFDYDVNDSPWPAEIKNKLSSINKNVDNVEVSLSKIENGIIHFTAQKHFNWNQEHISNLPHVNIILQLQGEFGKDMESVGKNNTLFSANAGFQDAIQKQIREYWLCAWYYLYKRHTLDGTLDVFKNDEKLKKELVDLGEEVMRVLDLDIFKSVKDEIFEIIEQLENT